MAKQYSSTSVQTALASAISNTATSMTVTANTGSALLGGVTLTAGDTFTVAIDPDTIYEEIVNITVRSTDTMTITRHEAGTSAVSHTAGAVVRHVLTSDDLIYFRAGVDAAVTLAGTQTLTNKTLTTPIISSISNTGTLTLPTSSDTLVGRATSDTLSNKTVLSAKEYITTSATAATGTVHFDAVTQSVLYYTTNASANWTLNVRGNGTTTLNSLLAVGESLTIAFMATQGSTAYYHTALTIDGVSATVKWQGASTPAAGNASGVDAYVFTIVKTASATYTVFGSQTRFA